MRPQTEQGRGRISLCYFSNIFTFMNITVECYFVGKNTNCSLFTLAVLHNCGFQILEQGYFVRPFCRDELHHRTL